MFNTARYVFFLLTAFISRAVLFPLPAAAQSSRLSTAWQMFEADPQLKYASYSLTVLDSRNGAIVFSKNGSVGLAPGSTLKTVTSASAFYLLSPSFRYRTGLAYTGAIDASGTLNGNLVIKGAGDPTLGSPRYPASTEAAVLKEWVSAVKEAGIKRIMGQIIGDDRLYDTQTVPDGWIWSDIGNYYGAGMPALSWRENQFDLVFAPGRRPGDPTSVRTIPSMPFADVRNEVKTGAAGSGDKVFAYSAPYSSLIYLRGTYGIDLEKRVGASVPDPALDAAGSLKEELAKYGINTAAAASIRQGGTRDNIDPAERLLSTHVSPSLKEIVYWLNQKSINLYAEQLLKAIAASKGRSTTTAEGTNVVRDLWASKAAIDPNSLVMLDGSGLSPENRITTQAIARVLYTVKKEPWFADYFESFPTINDIKMKSGSIKNVLAYAGYLTGPQPLNFSFIVNGYNGSQSEIKQKMFNVLNALKE